MTNQRAIKFRAWNKIIKIMEHNVHKWTEGPQSISFGYMVELKDEWEVMQFTDLHDKNGKEIYEGDIVRYFWPNDETNFHKNPVIVEWDSAISGWELNDVKDKYFDGLLYGSATYEVIGNIYENPELLNDRPEERTN